MKNINKMLKALSPLILAVFVCTFVVPAFGQDELNYIIILPSSVNRGTLSI